MIVHYFHLKCVPAHPFEYNSPLIIYAYAVKVTRFKLFQSVSRRNSKIINRNCGVDKHEFPPSGLLWQF
jgi:hypothetical protein